MKHVITGTTMPVLQMQLDPGEKIVAEPGEFSWMTENIQLNTTTQTAGATGLFSILGRALSGGGLFMTEYQAVGGPGMVAFSAKVPGTIHDVEIGPGHSYMIHKHGFLCGTEGVQLSIGFQRGLGAGLFGGNGFILQRVSGPCTAFVELGGECVMYDLPAGQSILAHPGHIGMFQDTVNFDITMMRGIRNALFGADGLFIARLTGPGKIWLQSMTVPNLAHAIAPYLGGAEAGAAASGGAAGVVASKFLGDIFGRS
ncbi:MAG TPA: AIM24 family protein [Stellaceae bacterium]|nr:AIM24 family protein [Stellaceae bacterium]